MDDCDEAIVCLSIEYIGIMGGLKKEWKPSCCVELPLSSSLDVLVDVILSWMMFDDRCHLYCFNMDDKRRESEDEIVCQDWFEEGTVHSLKMIDEVLLSELNLEVNKKFLFRFDLGDEHFFQIKVKRFGGGKAHPMVFDRKKSKCIPLQYPDVDGQELLC
ncbi:MAG: IS1096 element passenger TnpR family protein [Candidatus Thorarchaeota archaeon]